MFAFYDRCSDESIGVVTLQYDQDTCLSRSEIQSLHFAAQATIYSVRTLHTTEEMQRRVRLEEQQRIARDLHDTVVQDATGAVLQLQNASLTLASSGASEVEGLSTVEARHHVELAEQLTRRLMEGLRQKMWHLHDTEKCFSSPPGASSPAERFTEHALADAQRVLLPVAQNTKIQFKVIGDEVAVSRNISQEMIYVLCELLTNIVRHARATQIRIGFAFRDAMLRLSVSDNGCGFCKAAEHPLHHASDGSGFGLVGVRERVQSLRGRMAMVSRPGKGTCVRVVIPL